MSCRHSVSVCFVSSRSLPQRCMSASSRQWCVSDHEDRMEVVNNNVGQGRPVFEMLHRLDQTVLINHSCNEKTKHIHQNGYQLQILSNQYSSLQTLRSESQFKGHTDRILTIILYMYYFIPALITTVHRHNFLCNNHSPLPPPPTFCFQSFHTNIVI